MCKPRAHHLVVARAVKGIRQHHPSANTMPPQVIVRLELVLQRNLASGALVVLSVRVIPMEAAPALTPRGLHRLLIRSQTSVLVIRLEIAFRPHWDSERFDVLSVHVMPEMPLVTAAPPLPVVSHQGPAPAAVGLRGRSAGSDGTGARTPRSRSRSPVRQWPDGRTE